MAGESVAVWTLLFSTCVKVAMSEVPCSQPCLNGGRCHKFLDRCTCVGHWVGQYCDTATACASSPCFNGGTCESSVTTDFLCRCPENVFGDRCEINASDPCWSLPCQNGGRWRDPCISGPCQNGGSCTWTKEVYVCKCLQGFYGLSCEKVLNATMHHHPHSHGDLLSTSGGVVLMTILSLGGLFVLVGICYCCVPALRSLYPPSSSSEGQGRGSTTHPHVTSAAEELSSCSYQHGWKAASLAHGTAPLSGSMHGKSGAHAPVGYDGTYTVHADKPYRKSRTSASGDEGGEKQGAKVKRPSTPPPTYDECVVTLPRV